MKAYGNRPRICRMGDLTGSRHSKRGPKYHKQEENRLKKEK